MANPQPIKGTSPAAVNVGRNVSASVEGNKLTLVIDLKATPVASKSGKSNVVASTNGNIVVDGSGGLVLGLNAYFRA